MHSMHTLITLAADYKCQPFPAEQDHKAPVYLACLHLWSRINLIKKVAQRNLILLYGCVQVRGCSKGDAQCTSTELIDFSNKCRRSYGPCGTCKASNATFRGGFAVRTALWLCTYIEVGMFVMFYILCRRTLNLLRPIQRPMPAT